MSSEIYHNTEVQPEEVVYNDRNSHDATLLGGILASTLGSTTFINLMTENIQPRPENSAHLAIASLGFAIGGLVTAIKNYPQGNLALKMNDIFDSNYEATAKLQEQSLILKAQYELFIQRSPTSAVFR